MKLRYTLKNYLDATTHCSVGASFSVWFKMILGNITNIEWQFLPRVLFITLMVIIYAPMRLYERLFINRKIKNQKVEDPIFILGHYRSGTTFLHYLVGKDDKLAYASTIEAINPHTFVGNGKFSNFITNFVLPKTRPMDNLKMSPSLPFEEEFAMSNMGDASLSHGFYFPKRIQEHFNKSVLFQSAKMKAEWKKHFYFFLQKMSYKHPGKRLVLKTPANTARVAAILELFPNAKFIHIYRNPYKVYLSSEGLFENILPILSFHKVDNGLMENYILNSYKATYQNFLKDKSLLKKGQLTEVAYENFIKDPMSELDRMYKEIGMDYFEEVKPAVAEVLKEYKSYKTNKYIIDQDLKDKIYKKWSFAFEAFNYSKEGDVADGPIEFTEQQFTQLKKLTA